MPKNIFDTIIPQPTPGSGSVGQSEWIDLGLIPTGFRVWLVLAEYTSPDKSITFDVRSNTSGKSASGDSNTVSMYKASISPRKGTVTLDTYKKGRLHIVTVQGTGVEHWWLKVYSKSGSQGEYLWMLMHTLE